MARHAVAGYPPAVDPAAAAALQRYLSAISRRLPGPRRARETAIAELRDGLVDAWDHHRARGLGPIEAAHEAVTECGPVPVVAAAYTGVLADLRARRTGQALLLTGPIVGLLWLLALVPGRSVDALLLDVPALGGLVAAGGFAGVVTLAATGRARRWLPDVPGLAQLTACGACVAAAGVDAGVLAVAVGRVIVPETTALSIALGPAAAASGLRLCYSQYAARQHLRARTPGA